MSPPVRIRSLGCLDVAVDGTLLEFSGRGPRRPLELLGTLVAAGPHGASLGCIADLLWPQADGFDAYRALITTLHRLRRLLRHRSAVRLGAGNLRLDPTVCDIDVWHFESVLRDVGTAAELESALERYAGAFCGDDPSAWALGMRMRLEQAIARARRRLQASGMVRHQPPSAQIYTGFRSGDDGDVSARPRRCVADRRLDRRPE